MSTEFSVSRRKVLAGLGTIGIASAGAGLGTTAYFRDEEAVAAELQAGRLDLLLDFRATYRTWLDEAETDAIVDGPVVPDPDMEMNYVVGQAPDWRTVEGDALTGDEWAMMTRNVDACMFADTTDIRAEVEADQEIDGYIDGTPGDDDSFYPGYIDGEEGVLFSLDDVKPKDEGEATLSMHLCDNPAYVGLELDVLEAIENGVVEPENVGGFTDDDSASELANYIYTRVWEDQNCNNRLDAGEDGTVDVMLVLDVSGSMDDEAGKFETMKDGATTLVNTLGPNADIGLVTYESTATLEHGLGATDADLTSTINGLSAGGGTNIGAGIDAAHDEFTANGDSATQVMVVLTNGNPSTGSNEAVEANEAKDDGIEIYGIAYGTDANEAVIEEISSSTPKDGDIDDLDQYAFLATDFTDVVTIFEDIAQAIGGDTIVYQGSLAGLIEAVAGAENPFVDGLPLSEECLDPGVHCVAFDWYFVCEPGDFDRPSDVEGAATIGDELVAAGLPLDPNVAQTDTVDFRLTFNAVQCRHNMAMCETSVGEGFGKPQEFESGTDSMFCRARYGDSGGAQTWELAVGDAPVDGNETNAQYSWTSGQEVDWEAVYDGAGTLTWTFDGNTISDTGMPTPGDEIVLQTKAIEGSSVTGVLTEVLDGAGDPVSLGGPKSVTATGTSDGRDLQYLLVPDCADLAMDDGFTLRGTATVTLDGSYDTSQEEGVAFDVNIE